MVRFLRTCLPVLFVWVLPDPAGAEPIYPGGAFPALDEHMERHGRQFYNFNALPFGLSLDAMVPDDDARGLIDQFLAQDASDDVEEVCGRHPFEMFSSYGEYGDLGFFGGVAVAATAYEYIALKQAGVPAERLARARARVVRAAESWHVFYVVTGGAGLVARGIHRLVPEDPSDPPIPNAARATTPLFDADGNPLPQPKNNGERRDDNSGGLLPAGTWFWTDSCSKDQMAGQVFGMVALYDAMKDDPDIDQALVERMQEDARLVGQMLMTKREISAMEGPVGTGEYDLIIMDADSRPTYYHDLNPLSLEKIYFEHGSDSYNRFNLIMAIGVIKGLHHVSGDPAIEEFLYQEMLDHRGYLDMVNREQGSIDYIYLGTGTNFDNPDMTAVALWLALYHENDPEVTAVLREFLENAWWDRPDEPHTARLCKQPLWHAIYMTLTDRGVGPELVDETRDLLSGFDLGPYWDDRRVNCDEDELAAGSCIAIDGHTELTLSKLTEDGAMATEALHPSIRPPSNFNARSNPFEVNGGGAPRLNPGGDLLASYWICRAMQRNASGEVNLSPNARDHMPVGGWPPGQDGGTEPNDNGGCGCNQTGGGAAWLLAGLFMMLLRRRPG